MSARHGRLLAAQVDFVLDMESGGTHEPMGAPIPFDRHSDAESKGSRSSVMLYD